MQSHSKGHNSALAAEQNNICADRKKKYNKINESTHTHTHTSLGRETTSISFPSLSFANSLTEV